jgi:protein-S-isoprenylcysteine O-methyltransferase Ste14
MLATLLLLSLLLLMVVVLIGTFVTIVAHIRREGREREHA